MRITGVKDRRVVITDEESMLRYKGGRKTADYHVRYPADPTLLPCTVEKRTKTGVFFCGGRTETRLS